MTSKWVKNDSSDEYVWNKYCGNFIRGYISMRDRTGDYFWHVMRGSHSLSEVANDLDAAMRAADAALCLSDEEFTEAVVKILLKDMRELERKIFKLKPDLNLVPGYCAGFEAGVAATRQKVSDFLALPEQ